MAELNTLEPIYLEKFIEIAYQETGIRIAPEKKDFLQNRLTRRMKQLGMTSYVDYYRILTQRSSSELPEFIDTITTNETFFFRCPRHFHVLSREVLPQISTQDVTFWSAAASTGAEAYSLAILSLERVANSQQRKICIYASDIDRRALKKAHEGIFDQYALRMVRPAHLKKYFKGVGNGDYQVIPQLRNMVKLGRHNLKEPFPKGKVNIVFCRNVLIYFDEQSKRIVIENLLKALKPKGYLFLGESEIVPDHPSIRRVEASIAQKTE